MYLSAASTSGQAKVGIPKLSQQREPPRKANATRQGRVNRACLPCRSRKIKCNGATPRCANCAEGAAPCVYVSSRKDRLKTATGHNQDMIALLRDLRDHVSASGQRRIDHLLGSAVDDVADAASTLQKCPEKHSEPEAGEEAYVSAEVGSSADLDLLDEDLMQDEQTRATGFIGKASEIQWLRELHTRGAGENHTGPYGPPGRDLAATAERLTAMRQRQTKTPKVLMRTNKASYFLDDERSGLDLEADPFELPAFEVAEKLLQVYLETCHNTFPFLSTKAFLHHFYRYYAATNYGKAYEITRQWRAQMNLVFAIGAVYSHLTLADWCGDPRDHLLYHSRAWTLSLKDPWWFTHPDLAQMQTTGLFSFYYMTIGHINRSWILSGMALRFGYALGLHIRNEDRGTGIAHKENLARIWWAHYTLETLLASMTGRPNIGINRTCSVQLPLPISTEDIEEAIISSRFGGESRAYAGLFTPTRPVTSHHSPNSPNQSMHDSSTSSPEPANAGSYLKNLIQLGKITEDSLNLYTAKIVAESWQDIQQKIVRLTEELELWAMSLPERFSFYTRRGIADQRYERERNTLNILYHTTLILITRPCLCRLDRRIINQTAKSNEFNQKTAFACVESAKSVSRLLPNDPQLHLTILYKIGPWWIMVHTIMQSLMVLLLEISLETLQLPHDREEIVFSLKRLVRWLRAMSTNNRMAERAYSLVMNLLKVQGFNKKMDTSDLFQEDAQATAVATAAAAQDIFTPYSQNTYTAPDAHGNFTPDQGLYADIPLDAPQFQSDQVLYTDPNPARDAFAPAYSDPFTNSLGTSGSAFPGLLYTSFDEDNPLPIFGRDDQGQGVETGFGHH